MGARNIEVSYENKFLQIMYKVLFLSQHKVMMLSSQVIYDKCNTDIICIYYNKLYIIIIIL
jgi:hypothetical protein